MGKAVEQDLSSFMAVLIMTIGCLMVILVSNVIIIVSNPENTRITSIIRTAIWDDSEEEDKLVPFFDGNKFKEPSYIDVRRDRLILYPGATVVPVRDLEMEGNALERLLREVEEKKSEQYIVLLIRPRSSTIARQLQRAIRARGIDLGWDLFEDNRTVDYTGARKESGVEE